ncbi:MAG TPA: iron-containing alcohol dehydrogenase [Verrucomicrobiota bacterium]|nr:iron-containing alcohol dehydrogenase [Verrucomicrobiota bacterium]HNU52311.1 iron-containing alcohol dehydrogenase [Verrucomicrobiota bacterium]
MRFEFATAGRILFGAGTLREAGALAKSVGRRALVVTGAHPGRAAPLLDGLHAAGVAVCTFPVAGEPTIDAVMEGRAIARSEEAEVIVGMGGGSAIDAAKAIAALSTNDGEVLEYLEVIGRGRPLERPSAPCIAIPTTSGTGAEVTRNSVLASPAHGVKASLRSPWMLPRFAVVDPELTHGLPAEITAATGLDALTQLVEPYVSTRANPFTDALCVEGLRRVARALPRVWDDGSDAAAREDMALASLLGGLALANAGLGAVHGFAAPIGGRFPAPHGAVCAALLPHVMAVNLRALRERDTNSDALRRYAEIGRLLTGRAQAAADDAVDWVRDLCRTLRIRPLARFGLRRAEIPTVASQAALASSMKANPIVLTAPELEAILDAAL